MTTEQEVKNDYKTLVWILCQVLNQSEKEIEINDFTNINISIDSLIYKNYIERGEGIGWSDQRLDCHWKGKI